MHRQNLAIVLTVETNWAGALVSKHQSLGVVTIRPPLLGGLVGYHEVEPQSKIPCSFARKGIKEVYYTYYACGVLVSALAPTSMLMQMVG